jgi:hypothetical protein
MLALILAVVAMWFVLTGSFVLVMRAKRLMKESPLSLFWLVNILPWAFVGLVLDAAFNATCISSCRGSCCSRHAAAETD